MKKSLAIGLVATCMLACLRDAQASLLFRATLEGSQVNPPAGPTGSTATGTAQLTLNDARTRLEIMLSLAGLDLDGNQTPDPNDNVTAFHIHRAPAGINGSVVFGFISPNSDLNGDLIIDPVAGTLFSAWDLNEGNNTTLAAELPNLLSNGLYLNVHTPVFPGGEIRGQIEGVPEPATCAVWSLLLGLSGLGWVASRRGTACP